MVVDFNRLAEVEVPCMNGGTGTMSARMHVDGRFRMVLCRIHPGGSIGEHLQESGDDINYVLSGEGLATCDGAEEPLAAGVVHVCPRGSRHSIANTGDEDLVLLTVVVGGQ